VDLLAHALMKNAASCDTDELGTGLGSMDQCMVIGSSPDCVVFLSSFLSSLFFK